MSSTKVDEQTKAARTGYTRSDWLFISLAALTVLPLVLVIFFGLGARSSLLVALVTGVAILAAAFFLSWATEALETVLRLAKRSYYERIPLTTDVVFIISKGISLLCCFFSNELPCGVDVYCFVPLN